MSKSNMLIGRLENYMIREAQRALEKRYGFKPPLNAIKPLKIDDDNYIRFYVGDHEYKLMNGLLEDIGIFPCRGGYTHA